MVSYAVRVVVNGIWSTVTDNARRWGRALLGEVAALVTLLVSDNILAFTRAPYYVPVTYGVAALVILIFVYSRKQQWGLGFRKIVVQTSAWILSVIAIVLLQFAEKDVTYFDTAQLLSSYNSMVVIALLGLILLPLPFFVMSDLFRDMPNRIKAARQSRVPTIFNPEFIVRNKNESLFDRIVYVLQNL